MTGTTFTGAALVAGVAGSPIVHSLSPLLHNAWIAAAGLDAVYVPYAPVEGRFRAFIDGLRGGVVRGLNVTLPFKPAALAISDDASALARSAGAANLLLFHPDGCIEARNTDGEGLLYALARQVPAFRLTASPIAVIGAGGASRGAIAALQAAGASDIRVINRSRTRADQLAEQFPGVSSWGLDQAQAALDGVCAVINATSAEVAGGAGLPMDFSGAAPGAVAMDMLYRPLQTAFLKTAKAQGLQTVDGLDMLIGQAIPSFGAFFGLKPPATVDARALLIAAMGEDR